MPSPGSLSVENSEAARSAASRILIYALIIGLYTAQGIPIGLAFETFPTLLKANGVPLEQLAVWPIVVLPLALKFLWAPFVENTWYPKWGRRKTWLVPNQIIMIAALIALSAVAPTGANNTLLLSLVVIVSIAAATQDVAADGLAAEMLPPEALSNAGVIQVIGFMTGMFAGASGATLITGFLGYPIAMLLLAGMVALLLVPAIIWREPDLPKAAGQKASVMHFLRRPSARRLFVALVGTTLGGTALFSLCRVILIDMDWSIIEVGFAAGAFNTGALFVGCAIASLIINRIGLVMMLRAGLLATVLSAGLWVLLLIGAVAADKPVIYATIALNGLGIGMTAVSVYTLFLNYGRKHRQPGTDFAIMQSAQFLGEAVIIAAATGAAAVYGYLVAICIGAAFAGSVLLGTIFAPMVFQSIAATD